jgi:hypothetical protein
MKIELPDKRKRNVIIISTLAFLFLVGGGFLLWRVNQQRQLSPDYTDAGADPGDPGGDYCCRFMCCNGRWIKTNCRTTPPPAGVNLCEGVNMESQCAYNGGYSNCDEEETPVVKCYCQSWNDACGTNCTFPSGVQAEVNAAAQSDCRAKVAMCKIQTGDYVIENYTSSHPCYGKISQCKNPYAPNPCTPPPPPPPPPPPEEEPENKCDGGYWEIKPSGTYPYCDEIKYSFVAEDSDGIKLGSINVKLNGDVRANVSKTSIKSNDREVRVRETLGTATNCLQSGEYTLSASWEDKKDATGSACTLSTTFTVLEEIKNPDWDISKVVAESCIDENTENPKSRLEYIVTITNNGEGNGQITSIEDTLDDKVLEEYIETIGSNGQFSNGLITWTLTGAEREFASDTSKSYTYSFIIPSDAFGFYENTVEAKPSSGANLIANASISADCIILPEIPEEEEETEEMEEEDLPGTGVFDDGQSAIIVGFGLLFLGFTWNLIGKGVILSFQKVHEIKGDVVKRKGLDRKRKLEKKIIKD